MSQSREKRRRYILKCQYEDELYAWKLREPRKLFFIHWYFWKKKKPKWDDFKKRGKGE